MSLAPINDNFLLLAPKALDTRWGRFSGGAWRPYNDMSEFNTLMAFGGRYETQIVFVRSTTNPLRSDIFILDKNKNPYLLIPDIDLSNYYDKDDINGFNEELNEDIETAQSTAQSALDAIVNLQPKTDNALNTTSKTVVGGINEVKARADSADAKAVVAQEDAEDAYNNSETKIPLAQKDAVGGVPNIDGVFLKTTITGIRGFSGALKSNYYTTTDIYGMWYYDPMDTTSIDTMGSVLVTSDGKRLKRYIHTPLNPRWYGVVGDWDPIAKTGTDNTDAIQRMNDDARAKNLSSVSFEEGNFAARYYNDYQISITGRGKNTVFYSISPTETSFFRLAELGPIQRCEYSNFQVYGDFANNPNQNGWESIALPQPSGARTGGIWYSNWNNIEIKGFSKSQWYFECLDSSTSPSLGDMANQFLSFNDCKGIRPSDNISRCFKAVGQFGQIAWNNCNYDGNNSGAAVAGSVNVEIVGRPDSSSSDSSYTLNFYGLTSQNAESAILLNNCRVGIGFYGPYFENTVKAYELINSSACYVYNPTFNNAAKGSLIGQDGQGALALVGSNCYISIDNASQGGVIDRGVVNTGTYGGVKIRSLTKQLPISNPIAQLVIASNAVNTSAHNRVLLNTSASNLKIINSNLSYNDTIDFKIQPSGGLVSQIFEAGGNIDLNGLSSVLFRIGQTVRFIFNGVNWLLLNTNDAYIIYGTGSPEGVIIANKGAEFIRIDGGASTTKYVKTTDGVNTGWDTIFYLSQGLLKVNKTTTTQQVAIAADGSITTGGNNTVLVNANATVPLTSIISTLTVGDQLKLVVNGSGIAGSGLRTDFITVTGTALLSLGSFGQANNNSIVLRQGEVLTLERINLPFNGWVVTSAPKIKSVTGIPQTGTWFLGDKVYRDTPAVGEPESWVVTTPGEAVGATWAPTSIIGLGARRSVENRAYQATVAGTTGTVPPSHTSGTATDGTVTWQYVGVLVVFSPISIVGSYTASAPIVKIANTTDVVNQTFLNTNYPIASYPIDTIIKYYNQGMTYTRLTSTLWDFTPTNLLS